MLSAVAVLAGTVASCGAPAASAGAPGGKVAVVAAENVWGDIAAEIGGARVQVTSIISDPTADPHTYETDPRDAEAVAGAALVIENGAGYDDFMDSLLGGTNQGPGRTVVDVAHVVGATGANPNPHLWYSPAYVTAAARAIADRLIALDATGAAAFRANLQTFLAGYQPYIDALRMIRARYANTPVGYTERVAGYLVDAAGLRLATPASFAQAIEDGNDPSPADTASMDSAISARRIRLLLYNSQVTSPTTQRVKDLAAAAGVPVVGVAETVPASEPSMQRWQLDQARAILAALGG